MKFTDIFIRRPVLAIVVNLIIIIAGLQAISSLNVRQYPKSEVASITVTTPYIGASADLVRGFVTSPLERAIAASDGIEYIESQSLQGVSIITARLKLNYEGTKALAEINSRVNQVRNDLPPEAELPSVSLVPADSAFASMYLSFSADSLEPNQVTDYLVRVVQPALSAIEGVQRADILGGRTYAMRVWLKPDRLAALNISPTQVRQALGNNNVRAAVGTTKGAYIQVNLTANTSLETIEDFAHIIFHRNTSMPGPTCYLQDLFAMPEMRGRGIGRALIAAVYVRAREAGAGRVYWHTHESNATAMRLYDRVATRPGYVVYRKDL